MAVIRIKWRINKSYGLFIIIFYLFLMKDWLENKIAFLGYFDEIIALLAVPLFIRELLKNQYVLKIRGGTLNM